MSLFASSKKPQSIHGLHIGSSSIKCVEITHKKPDFFLNFAASENVSDGSLTSAENALKTLLKKLPNPPKNLRISLSGPSILTRRIQLPLMAPQELKSAIQFEAEGHIPFPLEECYLEHQILSTHPAKKNMDVLLIAAKKVFIQDYLKMFTALSIKPELIDIDILSLINAFEILCNEEAKKCHGLLHIGHNSSLFTIVHDSKPFIVREISSGGLHISKALAALRSVSAEEADKLKKQSTPETDAALKALLEKGLELLLRELRNSLNFFENDSDDPIETIWLSGGAAQTPGVQSFLSETLNKKFAFWPEAKHLKTEGAVNAEVFHASHHAYTIALGLALRPFK